MARWALGLLLFACGCSSPSSRFDSGYDVHVIVKPEPLTGQRRLTIEPVATVGWRKYHSEPVVFTRKTMPAQEVAMIRVGKGYYDFSVIDKRTSIGAREENLKVQKHIWIVMEMYRGKPKGKLTVYDTPPTRIGPWRPLVAVPD